MINDHFFEFIGRIDVFEISENQMSDDDKAIEIKIVCENVRQVLIKGFVRNLMSQKVAYDVQRDKYIEYEGSFSSRTKLIQLVKTVFNANDIDIHRALFDYYKMKKPGAETK